jgi:hypothetical protein
LTLPALTARLGRSTNLPRGAEVVASKADTKLRTLAYWGSTALSAGLFAAPGAALLARAPPLMHDMAHLGYPDYVLPLLGAWKIFGALVILAPRLARLKEWAYAGMVFDATGAAVSRAVLGDGPFAVALPLLISGVVLASWALRPAGRTLNAP